ncbi:MAG: 2-oxoacid:acceptor oxidoreductase subunit alpha [Gammaproteobacteria bacterium]|nr:2-oxoacid:acceptor oxidoreductase subunit alpha [Gammaproteobacteria bacterium]MCH9716216.1 2-oxoacid:acceptor oxidoreductase subunit alpha [Gammaproteobacteria bacterium]MCH9764188.1 2-oxoacid:acceptor oxidoreductase subunit alpha [Gammaproteobacteria bacterium]
MRPTTNSLVIRLTGDSGDGVQLIGEQLTITAALAGREVRTLPDFPAEIRAPAGTVAGVSGFQLAMSSEAIFTAGEELDVLVALNPAALKKALPYLKLGGLLILNKDSMTAKDFAKAGGSLDDLEAINTLYQVLSVPLVSETLAALKDLNLTTSETKKAKNCYVLGVVLWLFEFETSEALAFLEKKFQKNPVILEGNKRALLAGYNYAMTLELARQTFQMDAVARPPGEYRQVTGVDAVGLAIATLATGTETPVLVSGYPITPASGILHACAGLEAYGVELFQAEDEIAAIGACVGAAFGGCLALTCTSGPGLDLKSEMLGLAVVTELPLVVLDVQRAGTSTGLPTKTGQSDLQQALYGRHGEAPLPVLAASTPSDCFKTVIEAFALAVKYMTPVLVLLDAYLANAAEPWLIPNPEDIALPEIKFNRTEQPFTRDDNLSRSWNIPGYKHFIHQLGGLEKSGASGNISYEPDNHEAMVALRAEKIEKISSDYPELMIEGNPKASTLLVSWGSTYGSIKAALAECKTGDVAHVHLRHISPLPADLEDILKRFQHVLVAELNRGQLCALLREKYLINARLIGQCNGQPFSTSTLVSAIQADIKHDKKHAHAE